MKQTFKILILFILLSLKPFYAQYNIRTINWYGKTVDIVAGNLLLGIKKDKSITDIQDILETYSARVLDGPDILNIVLINVDDEKLLQALLDFSNCPNLDFVEPNFVGDVAAIFPNDPFFRGSAPPPENYNHQWYLDNQGQFSFKNDADIDAPEAWEYEKGSPDVTIAVLDSGIPIDSSVLSHPELNNIDRFIRGIDFVGDGNGVKDEMGHGSHVTGIIGANTNNNIGISGINWYSKIIIYQVFDRYGHTTVLNVKNAIIDAVSQQVSIINFSGGFKEYSNTLREAVEYAHNHNTLQIYSAGNNDNGFVRFPARFAFPPSINDTTENQKDWITAIESVISVASTTPYDERSSFSNFNPENIHITLAAPEGTNENYEVSDIFSCVPDYNNDSGNLFYKYAAGTSMAAAVVTGISSLILSSFPNYTSLDIKRLLINTCEDINSDSLPGPDIYLGHGRVNAFYAVAPPNVPSNFNIDAQIGTNPILSWEPNSEPDLAGYKIYQKIDDGDWSLLVVLDKDRVSFTDHGVTVTGGKFDPVISYKMTAFDISNLESDYTETKSVISNQINKNITLLPINILPGDFEEISVLNDDTLFAGKSFSGLYRTTEGPFANWDEISSVGVTKITVNSNNPANIFLCAGTNGLFESEDFGETWNDISSGLQLGSWETVMDLIIDPNNSQHLFCITSGIDYYDLYESTDGGVTWISKNLNTIVTKLKYVPFTDTLFMAYESELLISTDNGVNWDFLSSFDNFIGDFVLTRNNSTNIVVAVKNNIYETTDLGENWENISNGIVCNRIRQIVTSKKSFNSLYVLCDYGKIYYTNDAGENWQIFYEDNDMIINRIALSYNEEYLYIASDDGLYLMNLPVNVEEGISENPSKFSLYQNYPNPFNPTTTIEYSIPNVGAKNYSPQQNVQLKIYDVLGRGIATLVNEKQTPGNYSVKFDASNLPSGIYFYTLRSGNFVATKKMILMK